MRKRLANLLRRVANRLHPAPPAMPVIRADMPLPLEFIETHVLAHEICRRHDLAVCFWGRTRPNRPAAAGSRLDGGICWRMDRGNLPAVIQLIGSTIDTKLRSDS